MPLGPDYPELHSLGRGEDCAREACETVTLVWSNNPSAVVGVLICLAILFGWFKYVAPSLNKGEDDQESHAGKR